LQLDVLTVGVRPADRALDHLDAVEREISSGGFGEGDLGLIGVGRGEIQRALLRGDAEIAELVVDPIEEVADVVVGCNILADGGLRRGD
jgi:hypothetical protein